MSFISELFLNKHLQKCMNQKIYSHLKLHFIIFKKAPSLDNNKTKTVKKRRKCEDKTQVFNLYMLLVDFVRYSNVKKKET